MNRVHAGMSTDDSTLFGREHNALFHENAEDLWYSQRGQFGEKLGGVT